MRRIVRLVIILSVLAGVAAPASLAAERMWVGFHDDPSFRWVTNRQELVAGSAQNNASIIRLLVQWNLAAKTRPANATDPFDPDAIRAENAAVRTAELVARPALHRADLAQTFGTGAYAQVATVPTGGGGTWTFLAQPRVGTTYAASVNGTTRPP